MKKYISIAVGTAFLLSTSQAQISLDISSNKNGGGVDEVSEIKTTSKNSAGTAVVSKIKTITVTEEVPQDVEPTFDNGIFGIRFMPTISDIKVQDSDGNTAKGDAVVSYGYGALVGFNFNKHIGIQAEVMYSTLSQKYKDRTLDRQIDINYVNIPLLLSINTNRINVVNLNLVVGPQLGINVGSSIKTSGTTNGNGTADAQAVLAVKSNDLGVAYGAGLDFALNKARNIRLDVGFRGVMGLLDVSDRSETIETDSFYILQKKQTQSYSGYVGFALIF